MGVQDVTLPKGLIQAAAPQCKAHFSSEKERPATAALPVLGFSPCAGYAIFFCFPLKNCETASSLSCPCRLTNRKCVFLHILAFASWVLHHLILDFFSSHCSYYFLFQAFSDVLALSYFHGFIPHSQTVLDNALCLVLDWKIHPGPAGSIPSPSVSIKEKHLSCSSRAVLEKIPLSSKQTTRAGVRTSKM